MPSNCISIWEHSTCACAGAEEAGSEVLEMTAPEREALQVVTLERLENVCYGHTGPACMRIFYDYDRARCVGTFQVQESAYSPCTRVRPSVEYRVILFHVFYEKSSHKMERGAIGDC